MALFDLDGTITRTDTMLEFFAFAKGRLRAWFLLAAVFPFWCFARLRLVQMDAAKALVLRLAFRGVSTNLLTERAGRFAVERMPALLRPGALERIGWHRAQGHRVIVVTASCSVWVAPWCALHGIECIATELEVDRGSFTGNMSTPNCKGEEKVRRINAFLGEAHAPIHAYGDTPSDLPMLGLATVKNYKPFRPGTAVAVSPENANSIP